MPSSFLGVQVEGIPRFNPAVYQVRVSRKVTQPIAAAHFDVATEPSQDTDETERRGKLFALAQRLADRFASQWEQQPDLA